MKDFVNKCLKKDPEKRPDVRELQKHKFIKSAKKSNNLVEVIERYKKYKEVVPDSDSDDSGDKSEDESKDESSDDWVFNTITVSKQGKMKGDVSEKKLSKEPSREFSRSQVKDLVEEEEKKHFEEKSEEIKSETNPSKESEENIENQSAALKSVIYPALSKLLDENISSSVVANLKNAFDNAENLSPGITENLIINIIDILKK